MRRAVVTGLGAVTPLGATLDATRDALARGESALRPATLFDAAPFGEARAAELLDLDPRRHFRTPKAVKLTDRRTRFAVCAAAMALEDAGYPEDDGSRERLGVLVGTSGSDLLAPDLARAVGPDPEARCARDVPDFARKVLGGLSPLWLLVVLPNMASAHVAIQVGATGPNSAVMTELPAGLSAIAEAADWIARGEADAVLAGGADCGTFGFAYAAFEQAGLFRGALPAGGTGGDASQPGFVPGEGAAVVLLEEEGSARARGARIRGAVLGGGSAAGERGSAEPLARAVREALARGGVDAAAVGTVRAATILAEPFASAEEEALGTLLGFGRGLPGEGGQTSPAPAAAARVSSATGRAGHLLAAAGALEAVLLLSDGPGPGARTPALVCSLGYSGAAAALVLAPAGSGGGGGTT